MNTEEQLAWIENKIRTNLEKYNLKLIPSVYYDSKIGMCCAIGALNADRVPVFEMGPQWYSIAFNEVPRSDLQLVEAGSMDWGVANINKENPFYLFGKRLREEAKTTYPELFAIHCEGKDYEDETESEDDDYDY